MEFGKSEAQLESDVKTTYANAMSAAMESPLINYESINNVSLRDALKHLIEAPRLIEALEIERNSMINNYVGDRLEYGKMLADKHLKHAKGMIADALNNLQTSLTNPLKKARNIAVEKGKADALNANEISDDYKLLSLPTKLTAAELQTLYDRNWNNPPFVRALKEYETKNKTRENEKTGAGVNYTSDPYTQAINSISNVISNIGSKYYHMGGAQFMIDNPRKLQEWDSTIEAAYSCLDQSQ